MKFWFGAENGGDEAAIGLALMWVVMVGSFLIALIWSVF